MRCTHTESKCDTKYEDPITKRIIDRIKYSIVKIKFNKDINSIGFFMKMKVNNKEMKCLFICNHLISNNDIKNKIIINIIYDKKGKEEEINIRLDENLRFIKNFNNNENITLIEIIKNDGIPEDKYLEPDLNYDDEFNKYKNLNIYLASYPGNSNVNEKSISLGRVTKVLDNKFEYILDNNVGSFGSPICNNNCQVIGIYTSKNKNENINYGTFIGKIIDTLNNK